MNVCPLCGSTYDEKVDFCFQDGAPLVRQAGVAPPAAPAAVDVLDVPEPAAFQKRAVEAATAPLDAAELPTTPVAPAAPAAAPLPLGPAARPAGEVKIRPPEETAPFLRGQGGAFSAETLVPEDDDALPPPTPLGPAASAAADVFAAPTEELPAAAALAAGVGPVATVAEPPVEAGAPRPLVVTERTRPSAEPAAPAPPAPPAWADDPAEEPAAEGSNRKGGLPLPLIGGGVVVVLGLAAAVLFAVRPGDAPPAPPPPAEVAEVAPPPAAAPAPVPAAEPEPAAPVDAPPPAPTEVAAAAPPAPAAAAPAAAAPAAAAPASTAPAASTSSSRPPAPAPAAPAPGPSKAAPPASGGSPWGGGAGGSTSADAAGNPWGGGSAAQTATLLVTTTPPGAKVFVDDREVGRSPHTGQLSLGRHSIRVELDGYKPATRAVDASAGDVVIPFELRPVVVSGQVNIFGTAGATVYVDGTRLGQIPVTATISEGPHTFEVVAADGTRFTQQHDVRFAVPGKPVTLSLNAR